MTRGTLWIAALAVFLVTGAATFLLLGAGTRRPTPEPGLALPETTRVELPTGKAATYRGSIRDSSTGVAIRGAMVSLIASTGQGSQGSSSVEAVTGSDGAFEIPQGAGAPVVLTVAAKGYVDGRWDFNRSQSVPIPLSGPWNLTLVPGRTVRGTVLDDRGTPIPGARVWIAQFPSLGMTSAGSQTTVRPDGTFELSGARPGPALIKVSAPGWTQEGYPSTPEALVAMDASLPANCRVVVPESGGATIAITMRRGGTVSGILVDHEGRPQAGKRLELYGEGWMSSGSALTRPDGTFSFHGVPGAKGLSVSTSLGGTRGSDPKFDVPEGGSVEGLRVVMPRAASVHGVVVDAAGHPVEGAKLNVLPGGAAMHWEYAPEGGPGPSATSGADGTFRITDLIDQANQVVLVKHAAFADGAHEVYRLQSGEERGPLRIVLEPDSPIRGVVVDEAGRPVGGAVVTAGPTRDLRSAPAYQINPGVGGIVNATSDSEGRFEVRGLAAGPRAIGAAAPGYLPVADSVEGEKARLVLLRPREIEGVVRDVGTGRGIPKAMVQAHIVDSSKGGSYARTETDGQGKFRLEGLRPGGHKVTVEAPGTWLYSPVPRVDAGVKHVEFDLRRAYVIDGRVLDPEGRRLEHGNIAVYDAATGKHVGSHRYESDGYFRMSPIAAGRYRIVAYPSGWRRGAQKSGELVPAEITDVEAGTEDVEIRLARGVSLRGRVVDETGRAKSLALGIALFPSGEGKPDDERKRWGKAEPDGSFEFTGLDPRSPWDLALQGREAGVGSVLRGVRAGQEGVVLVIEPGLTITGRVVDESGAPVSGIELQAEALDVRGLEDGTRSKTNSKSPWVEDTCIIPRPVESEESKRMQLGGFVLKGLGRFRFRVTVRTGRTEWAPASVEVSAGSDEPIEILLRSGATIEGRVNGTWKGRLYIYADPADGNKTGISYTSVRDDGTFSIRGLAPGPHRLRMNFHSSKEGAQVSGPFDAPATGVELRWE